MWSFILDGDKDLMLNTDRFTVETLQLRAPQVSGDDFSFLKSLFDSGKLFSRISEEEKRRSIWKNIATITCLIPSLYTLFEDLKLLSPCVKIMKALIEPPFKGSLHDMMEQRFSGANQTTGEIVTQETETVFSTRAGSGADQFEFGYRQLYLFALRHFARMIGECAKKEKDRPKPTIEEPDPVTWHRFALLADRLGFDSEIIRKLKTDDPFRAEARNFVLKHNPPELYDLNPEVFENCVEQLARARAEAVEKQRQYIKPPAVVDGPGESLPRRCGRFFQTAYEYERNYLFLGVLYDGTNARGKGITSIFVRRSIYFAFFGRRLPNATAEAPRGRPPQKPEGIMTGGSDGSSPHDAVSGPAPTQCIPDEHAARRGERRDRPTPPPPSSQAQMALVPTSQTSEMVCIHLSAIVHIRKLRLTKEVVTPMDEGNMKIPRHRITFQVYQRGGLQDQQRSMSYNDPSEVKRVATKYVRKGMHLMTMRGRGLTPERCYDAVVSDGTYTVVLIPREESEINKLLIVSGVGVARKEPQNPILEPKRKMITER